MMPLVWAFLARPPDSVQPGQASVLAGSSPGKVIMLDKWRYVIVTEAGGV